MRFYKQTKDGYVLAVGVGFGFEEITESEYNVIIGIIADKPKETEEIGYRLKTDLTWETYEKDPPPAPSPDDDVDDSEALSILLGGAT